MLGLIGAAVMFATTLVRDPRARTAALSFALAGGLFSLYLAGLQAFKIHAYCAGCLSSAVLSLALTVTTAVGWYRALPEE